ILRRAKSGFIDKRAAAIAAFPDFDGLRERGRRIKDHTLAHLDHYLERFADAVEARGGHVHWARDADEARRAVLDICQRAQARSVIQGQTTVGEELGPNRPPAPDPPEAGRPPPPPHPLPPPQHPPPPTPPP